MTELLIKTNTTLTADQISFVQESLERSFAIDSIEYKDDNLIIDISTDQHHQEITKATKRLFFVAKSINKDLLYESHVTPKYCKDPQPFLEERRDVIPVHPGFFTFQGDFLRVFHAVNTQIRKIAADLGAIEQEYPAVWPVRLFKKINYLNEFPQQVILCAPVKDDYESRKEFSIKYEKNQPYESVKMDHLIANAEYGLEPAVCDCCYYGLENQSELNDSFYTCYNKVFRNERSGSNQLDRLTNFSVRDIMFVGTEQFVLESRQVLIDRLSIFLETLQIAVKIETANDPFFANESSMKSVFQNSHKLKYELLAAIPHLKKNISIGSINFHMDFFGSAFDISTGKNVPAQSGCIGIGMERTAYALFCQHGPDLRDWPEDVIRFLDLEN